MPREVTILTLLQEIRYLKQELAKTPELHWLGLDQWLSTRPMARKGVYSSDTELLPHHVFKLFTQMLHLLSFLHAVIELFHIDNLL